ncbi:MAG: 2-C-methyl-D-erythritol 4-phosphate cytidylyltransferase [Actinomycetia bacterium]|nr:2-C-methyl-D-erythritol 4-phosphate cytidylyltransferase [Actinomycetes bacterium]
MDANMPIWGLLLAAGQGTRFGRQKHDIELGGVPLWRQSERALLDGGVERLVVVGDLDGAVPGGDRRRDSVASGLAVISDHAGFVLIHDAARPLVTADLVRAVIDRLLVGDVAGVVPVVPVRDTLKRVAGEFVVETVDRADLVAVQTPQGFNLKTLRAAHAVAGGDATDDASMVEAAGGTIAIVDGDPANLKVTYPEDLAVAEALRSGRHG